MIAYLQVYEAKKIVETSVGEIQKKDILTWLRFGLNSAQKILVIVLKTV